MSEYKDLARIVLKEHEQVLMDVDDEEVEIHLANYAFRAVEIPEGKHTIKFVYQPRSFLDGLRVTMISIIVLILSPLYLNRVLGKEEKESYT